MVMVVYGGMAIMGNGGRGGGGGHSYFGRVNGGGFVVVVAQVFGVAILGGIQLQPSFWR